jgi:hypothetical protein
MDAKETVKQGLQARKDARAAELRAEKLREDVAAANDARFREQMRYWTAERRWQAEKEILVGTVYRQQNTIRELREEKAKLLRREQEGRQLRTLIGAVEAVAILALLIVVQDLGLIVSWLATSLMAAVATYLFFAVVALIRGKK